MTYVRKNAEVISLVGKEHLGQRRIRKEEQRKAEKSEDVIPSPTHVVINVQEKIPEKLPERREEEGDER